MPTVIRYAALLVMLVKIALMRQMAYRLNFFMMVAGKVIRIALLFFFFQAIFVKVNRIGGWSYEQVLLLFATFHLVDFVMSITFQRNLSFHLPRLIQVGELDARMLLPVNLLFTISLENIDMMDFFSFIPSLCFLGYVFYRLDFAFSWLQIGTYLLLVINALAFLFALVLLISSISFWTTQSYGIARMLDNLLRICRYPLDIFEGAWKIFLIYFLPLVLVAQLPSRALLSLLHPAAVLAAFGLTAIFMVAALLMWKSGLRNYMSVSS